MNLTSSGLLSSARQDVITRQLSNMAKSGLTYDQTSKAKVSNHETDKQAEDNATWYFEYRALLNSKLTTLTTALTSAYTTDLDAAMGLNTGSIDTNNSAYSHDIWQKSAMQGRTGAPKFGSTVPDIDPGATRTTYAYLLGFGDSINPTGTGFTATTTAVLPAVDANYRGWAGDINHAADQTASGGINFGTVYQRDAGNTTNTITDAVTGTTTFMNSGAFELDRLKIDFKNTGVSKDVATGNVYQFNAGSVLDTGNRYLASKDAAIQKDSQGRVAGLTNGPLTTTDGTPTYQRIGNNFETTLFKFFERPENFDILKFGLFDSLYVVGTSSLATGSQVQGSISLNWDVNNGEVVIKQERFAAFFHS